jgi:hypothetical protein
LRVRVGEWLIQCAKKANPEAALCKSSSSWVSLYAAYVLSLNIALHGADVTEAEKARGRSQRGLAERDRRSLNAWPNCGSSSW